MSHSVVNATCPTCCGVFVANSHNHIYCRNECRASYQQQLDRQDAARRGPFQQERECEECGETYIAKSTTQRWCGPECTAIRYRKGLEQKKQERRNKHQTERELIKRRLWQIPRDLRLSNEEEFTQWFAGHHILFGVREIVRKGDTSELHPTKYFEAITEVAGDMLGAVLQSPEKGLNSSPTDSTDQYEI